MTQLHSFLLSAYFLTLFNTFPLVTTVSTSLLIMFFSSLTVLALGTAGVSSSAVHMRGLGLQSRQDVGQFVGANSGGGAQCLTPDLIQAASDKTGQEPGTDGIKPGK